MVDNQLMGIANHEVQLVVEGIVINTLSTDDKFMDLPSGFTTFDFDQQNRWPMFKAGHRSGEGNVSFFCPIVHGDPLLR